MTFLLTFIMLLNVMILVSQGKVCTPPVTSLTPYSGLCQTDVQCITRQCINKRCHCSGNFHFDHCTARCLPNCGTTLSQTKGVIATPDYFHGSTHSCAWTFTGRSSDSYVVFTSQN
ncbi:uncharacterized protein LOC129926665 [Biomphalaria glabrata]|uniref:Uncharacterized protein LOC129926665 n=1 Tax=Biomphalaria glabrata TaxID=6526 RepID=A0A9W3ALB8_BIOGL|nr:uncharacterized protein LOC129926665 [Biomphalaria glabrata]